MSSRLRDLFTFHIAPSRRNFEVSLARLRDLFTSLIASARARNSNDLFDHLYVVLPKEGFNTI